MNDKVLRRVFEYAEFVDNSLESGTRIFTALVGSQNYGLEKENSPINTKSIFVPTFSNAIFENALVLSDDIFDVRKMAEKLLTREDFVEILYTPYVDINPQYVDFYDQLLGIREAIAYYYPSRNLEIMANKVFDYCYKTSYALAEAYRICQEMERYAKNYPFEEVLNGSEYREQYLSIMRGELSAEETKDLSMELSIRSERIRRSAQYQDFFNIGAEKELYSIIRELLRKEYGVK